MGCDGGTIPKRKEVVKNKDRPARQERNKDAKEADRWFSCSVCEWILTKPIVAGHWGHIFCKECILEFLIEHYKKDTVDSYHLLADKSPVLDSVHSMKDIKELKLKENPAYKENPASEKGDGSCKPMFVCPITGLETNGKYKFVFSWNCGCVVSERAVKEVPNDDKCLVCQTPYIEIDLITLNPTGKELEKNQCKFLARKMRKYVMDGKTSTDEDSSTSSRDTLGWPKAGNSSSRTKPKGSRLAGHRRVQQQQRHRDGAGPSTDQPGASTSRGDPEASTSGRRSRQDDDEVSSSSDLKKQRS